MTATKAAVTQFPPYYSYEALIKSFPGFTNQYATVNGVKLHYVEGGKGTPLICSQAGHQHGTLTILLHKILQKYSG